MDDYKQEHNNNVQNKPSKEQVRDIIIEALSGTVRTTFWMADVFLTGAGYYNER